MDNFIAFLIRLIVFFPLPTGLILIILIMLGI